MWFTTRSDTNKAVQSQKMPIGLNFKKNRDCTIRVAKTKALISFAVTAKLICALGFAFADCWFSHEATHLLNTQFMPFINIDLKRLKDVGEVMNLLFTNKFQEIVSIPC